MEEGGREVTTLLISDEIGTGGGAEGTLFTSTVDVGMRGGGGGRVAEGAGSAMQGHVLTFTIFRIKKIFQKC